MADKKVRGHTLTNRKGRSFAKLENQGSTKTRNFIGTVNPRFTSFPPKW